MRWATWSWSNWNKHWRLFSVLLPWSTHQRDWPCVNAASGFQQIKVRWNESEQLWQRWQLHTFVPQQILSRGTKNGHNPWQTDHAKAMDARRGPTKKQPQVYLHIGPMAERRDLPSFSIGARLDWRVCRVSRSHLPDWHQLWGTLQTAKSVGKYALHERRYSNSLADKTKRHIGSSSPTTFRLVEFQLEDVFLVIFILNMDGGPNVIELFILGPSNDKHGTLNDGKTKNVGISDNLDNVRVTYRPVQRDLYGDVRAKWSQLLPSFTWMWIPFVVLRTTQIFCPYWQFGAQTVATAMNAAGGVQLTDHHTHACAHFISLWTSHVNARVTQG